MIDIEELKRLHAERNECTPTAILWADAITKAWPALLAKLEAAQRLRETVAICLSIESPAMLREALAAFDKEQQ